MTTLFGNPGSTELPMLSEFPADFRYILGLQEAVAVGIADGYAQASGAPGARQPPHRAGPGQRDGGDLQRAGQQVAAGGDRGPAVPLADDAAGQSDQPRRHANAAPAGEVELRAALRAGRAARAGARGAHRRAAPARARVRVDPDGRLVRGGALGGGGAPPDHTRRERRGGPARRVDASRTSRGAWLEASNPALVAGPDIDAAGGWEAAVALAERARLPVYATPATGGGRLGFPENHPLFQAILPPAVQPLGEVLAPHDFVLARGHLDLPLLPQHPRPAAGAGHEPDGDHLRPRRGGASADGRRDRGGRGADAGGAGGRGGGDVGEKGGGGGGGGSSSSGASAGLALAAAQGAINRESPPVRAAPEAVPLTDPMSPSTAVRALAEVFPEDGIVVLESPSATPALRNQLRLGRPGSYYFSAGGGPRLRDAGVDRRAAGLPGAPGGVRDRRGLGAVRGAELLDGGGLQSAGDVPRAAQRGVRDPQVLLAAGGDPGRARPGPAGARHRGGGGGVRHERAPARTTPRSSAWSCAARWPRRSRSWSKCRSPRAWRWREPSVISVLFSSPNQIRTRLILIWLGAKR